MNEVERKNISKLMPQISHYTKPFWEALQNKELMIQKCKECGHIQFPPGPVCTICLSEKREWIKCSGKATLWSKVGFWKQYLEPYSDTPYYVVLARLEEGPIITGRISKEDSSTVSFDSPLVATFYKTVDGNVLLGFKPA